MNTKRQSRTKHPYAAIEWRVLDSPAYADLSFSAQALLLLLARQLTKVNNNGHLQASFKWCKRFGFGSEHTLRKAIAELISHGFVYRSRSHGANGVWARYALTWVPLSDDTKDLFLGGYKACAWRDWQPSEKKAGGRKCQIIRQKVQFHPENLAKNAGKLAAENAPYVLSTSGECCVHSVRGAKTRINHVKESI